MAAVPPPSVARRSDTYRGQYDTDHLRGARISAASSTVIPPAQTVRGPSGEPGVEGPQGVGAELPEVAPTAFTAVVTAANLPGWTTRFSTTTSSLVQPLPPAHSGGSSVRVGWSTAADITTFSLSAAGTDVIGDGSDTTFLFTAVGQVLELQPVDGRWRYVSGQRASSAGTTYPNGPTTGRPTAASVGVGYQWYDTTLHKPVWSDGTTWRDAAGTAV